jgi:1,4-dihydroxy-6-naphthoate synthase
MTREISIAYSPDTDDAFMVHALRSGKLPAPGYDFSFVSADIQELNEAATRGVYDVTAISIAAYPSISDAYYMMPIGASIGDEFGPALIVRKDSPIQSPADLKGKRVAIPGRQTSAYFAARGLIGPFEAEPLHFLKIGPAVMAGEVDAGILIHELQLDCEAKGFRKLGDLGRLWHEAYRLPLPLGANAIKRSLGADVIRQVTELLRESIKVGLADREATLKAALSQSKAELDPAFGDRYISMYVNDRSLAFQPDVRDGIGRLFQLGEASGLCKRVELAEAFYE